MRCFLQIANHLRGKLQPACYWPMLTSRQALVFDSKQASIVTDATAKDARNRTRRYCCRQSLGPFARFELNRLPPEQSWHRQVASEHKINTTCPQKSSKIATNSLSSLARPHRSLSLSLSFSGLLFDALARIHSTLRRLAPALLPLSICSQHQVWRSP